MSCVTHHHRHQREGAAPLASVIASKAGKLMNGPHKYKALAWRRAKNRQFRWALLRYIVCSHILRICGAMMNVNDNGSERVYSWLIKM